MPIAIILNCPHCHSEDLIRYGSTPDGRKRYKCNACGKQHREGAKAHGYSPEEKAKILAASEESTSLRALSRAFGVSRNTVKAWRKQGVLETTNTSETPENSQLSSPTSEHPAHA
jgi:transposase-like protein